MPPLMLAILFAIAMKGISVLNAWTERPDRVPGTGSRWNVE